MSPIALLFALLHPLEATAPPDSGVVASTFLVEHAAVERAAASRPGATRADDPLRNGATAAALAAAQARMAAKDWQGAADAVLEHLRRARGDGALHDLLAQALEKLERRDEAAHHYAAAARLHAEEGHEVPARTALAGLRRADPLAGRREAFERKVVADLYSSAEELHAQGHPVRALELLEPIQSLAQGKDAERARLLCEKARASSREVDLDEQTLARPADGEWPKVELESQHYRFACHLEPDLVKKLGEVMDDLHGHYVTVYFEGNAKKARGEKATIRILPTRARMLELWQGGGNGPEGWWSPGTGEVTTYDTRSRGGKLDEMLETLYHEASHQFTTLASGGGYVPAWLNEGTASFFEGTRSMADHRVLWPDAAFGRLATLVYELKTDGGPTALDVVTYSSQASYPAEYYAFGWGLVYFLQQYEEPATLRHVYRPLYARYQDEVVKRAGDSLPLFEEIFLGRSSPLGHAGFADFERAWSKWITDEVRPLYGTEKQARELRLARVARYVAAADAAKGGRKADPDEAELLERALGDIEYVVAVIDGAEEPDGALLVQQADVLERLERTAAAAPLVQRALDLADQERYAIDEARYAELEKRLQRLDRRNAALRSARSKLAGLVRAGRLLLEDYRARGDDSVLRAYTFSAEVGGALGDTGGMLARSLELREAARVKGRLQGSIFALQAPTDRWITTYNSPKGSFSAAGGGVTIESVRPLAYVDPTFELRSEYELRARLQRAKPELGAAAGFVVAGRTGSPWTLVGVDERGHAGVWEVIPGSKDTVTTRRTVTLSLEKPLPADEETTLVVRVRADGRMEIRVGERAAVEARLALDPALPRHAGIFVKNGRATLTDFVAEQMP